MTDMDQPLGMAVGNAIEVDEAIQTLRGAGPQTLTELCLVLGARMLVLGKVAATTGGARKILEDALTSGRALAMFSEWVEAQGGDPRVATNPSLLPRAARTREVRFDRSGFVTSFDAEGVGRSAMLLGAGRASKEDAVDPGAGLVLAVRSCDRVEVGDTIATLYAATESQLDAAEERLIASVHVGDRCPRPRPLYQELEF